MDPPTREKPAIHVPGGPVTIMRGYEAIEGDKYVFVGCHDGPLLEIKGPHDSLLMSVEFVPQIIAALQAAIVPPVAEKGAHDAELQAMGFKLPPT